MHSVPQTELAGAGEGVQASSASRMCSGDMGARSRCIVMVPSSDALVCSPLPSTGSRGRHSFPGPAVPPLHRYYGLIRFLTVLRPRSLVALDHELPLLYVAGGNCEVFPSSWRIPLKTCRGLETPAASGILAISVARMLPSASIKTSASAMNRFRS